MLDYRIQTFLTLFQTMNYRQTAQQLNMTQPTVTQHIHALEQEYGCRLFHYDGRKLHRTQAAESLAFYARASLCNDREFRRSVSQPNNAPLRIGATRSIGEFVIGDMLLSYLKNPENTITLNVDNTQVLLNMLEQGELDFAILEGKFDKQKYAYQLMRREALVGICARSHPLAGKMVSLEELFDQTLILREPGSGTRAIFEQILRDFSYAPECFHRTLCVNNLDTICHLVAGGAGISFVYQAVAESKQNLASFMLEDLPVVREFNYVYLNETTAERTVGKFRQHEYVLPSRRE